MTMPPMTAQEITEIINKAMEKKGDLHARISLSGGIEIDTVNKQVLRRSLYPKIEIDIPPDKPDLLDALHKTQSTLNLLIDEFMSAHLLKTSNAPATQSPKAEGWDSLPWRDGPYGQWIFADEPRAKGLTSMIFAAQGGKFESGEWIYNVSKSKQDGREFLNRVKKATAK